MSLGGEGEKPVNCLLLIQLHKHNLSGQRVHRGGDRMGAELSPLEAGY